MTTASLDTRVRVERRRLPGPDVVRAVALIGVAIMNFYGYMVIADGEARADGVVGRFFDPWTGPLSTRFAATFVLTAGVGVTLLTRRTAGDPALTAARRVTLVRRGLALYGFGLVFDWIWPGTILPFYGVMFVVAAVLFTLRIRWIVLVGIVAALAGAAIAQWRFERQLDGGSTAWLETASRSPRQLVLDMFVNGTHPLLPWLAFFCAGIVVGRLLDEAWWRVAAIAGGGTMFGLAQIVSGTAGTTPRAAQLTSTDPFDRGLLYVASALGTALIAFGGISWLAERSPRTAPVRALQAAGAMSLSLYVGHALFFNLLVRELGWVEPSGLAMALTLAGIYWALAVLVAVWWRTAVGIGPAEWLYRRLGG